MIICKICAHKCVSFRGIAFHIRVHNITSKQYYDKFYKKKNEGLCVLCNNKTAFYGLGRRAYGKFCEYSCRSKYYNAGKANPMYGKTRSEEYKQNVSKRFKDIPLSKEHRQKISKANTSKKRSKESRKNYKMAAIRTGSFINFLKNKKDTQIELKLQQALKDAKIKFMTQINILNRTQSDIFIEPNLAIFADGDYWHGDNFPRHQKRDRNVSAYLRRHGYSVFRFKEKDINSNLEKCINKIKNHLSFFKEYYNQKIAYT